ncbi:MAG: chorismate mutase [Candidatus Methanofastidiosa archaeon]|nr:chorismate mutase [Candidatus Methanofastidiosa archaeon]HOM95599.1 chorismate mutase [Methanofastidiosum sp.]HPC81307.1 chorismate mutase [Methanofastidiosum sp.]HRS24927.1 chorismate mutase [Methanofastidiosum sp.]
MESSIETLREEINRIDESIIKLLSARMEVAKKIAFLKKEMGMPIEDRGRERIIFLKLDDDARSNNLDENFVSDIFEKIISHSKLLQTNIMEG